MSVFVIAEAGVNHNGSLDAAKQLVNAAVEAGADAVKFQTFKTENLVTANAEQAAYQTANTGIKESQFAMLKRLELSERDHLELVAYCRQKNIEFMSTPFDDDSIHLLHQLGMLRWKIPSGELLSIPYLRKIAAFNQPTILSTGMGNLEEVALAIETLLTAGLSKSNLTVLHANTAYPTPYEDVNLRAMLTLAETFEVAVGLSDHSLGIEVPIAAVALGATVIEKHFTLDKTLPGPDHKASLEPHELKAMVTAIRHIELALGSGEKTASNSEKQNKAVARKRIV
ncbi:MAG: N-acetylneuraminate synthase, partial [Gammaproteobacteria bacterium]|nr:N-acetylneuraminate synthase [Gammaproteobacteria bacterium]